MKKYIIFLLSLFVFFPNVVFASSPNPDKYVSTKEVGNFVFDDQGFLPSNVIAEISKHNTATQNEKSKIIYAVAVIKKDTDFTKDFDDIDDLAKAFAEKHKTKDDNGLGALFLINPNSVNKDDLLFDNSSKDSTWIFSQSLAAGINQETQDYITSEFFSEESSSIDYLIKQKATGDYSDTYLEKHFSKFFSSLTGTISKNYSGSSDLPNSPIKATKKKSQAVSLHIEFKKILKPIKKIFTLKRIVLGIFAIFGIIYVIKYHKLTKNNEKYYI